MQSSKLDSMIFSLLCLILVWMPIPLGSHRPWSWSILEILIGIGFILHLVNCCRQHGPWLIQNWHGWILAPVAILQVFLALQIAGIVPGISTVDPMQTEIMLVKGLFYLMWLSLLLTYVNERQRLRLLIIAIVVSGSLQAFYGIVINLSALPNSPLIDMDEGNRARGSFVYQNHFANYLAISLSMGLGLLIAQLSSQRSHRSWRVLLRDVLSTLLSAKFMLRMAMIIMVIGLVLSRSRMGNAAFFSALFATSLFAIFCYKRPPALLKPLVISIFILDMLVIGSMFGLEKLQQRYAETSFASETRDEVVKDSLPIITEHLWTGTGGSTFYTVFPGYQPNVYSAFYDHAHNEYVQFSVELGVPITLMLGGWILLMLYRATVVMRVSSLKLYRGVAFGGAMAIIHMLLHNTVDFNLQAPANAVLFLTVLALIQISYQQRLLKRHRSPIADGVVDPDFD